VHLEVDKMTGSFSLKKGVKNGMAGLYRILQVHWG
jgi:hypothetical protein